MDQVATIVMLMGFIIVLANILRREPAPPSVSVNWEGGARAAGPSTPVQLPSRRAGVALVALLIVAGLALVLAGASSGTSAAAHTGGPTSSLAAPQSSANWNGPEGTLGAPTFGPYLACAACVNWNGPEGSVAPPTFGPYLACAACVNWNGPEGAVTVPASGPYSACAACVNWNGPEGAVTLPASGSYSACAACVNWNGPEGTPAPGPG